jgi:hypothetical protein
VGEHNVEGEWSKSKKENNQKTPSLSLEKLPLFVHMLRGFFLTVCECRPDASGREERGGRKQSTKKQKTCDRLEHIRGKISQYLLLRIMSELST